MSSRRWWLVRTVHSINSAVQRLQCALISLPCQYSERPYKLTYIFTASTVIVLLPLEIMIMVKYTTIALVASLTMVTHRQRLPEGVVGFLMLFYDSQPQLHLHSSPVLFYRNAPPRHTVLAPRRFSSEPSLEWRGLFAVGSKSRKHALL